jgi:hypothetical protein
MHFYSKYERTLHIYIQIRHRNMYKYIHLDTALIQSKKIVPFIAHFLFYHIYVYIYVYTKACEYLFTNTTCIHVYTIALQSYLIKWNGTGYSTFFIFVSRSTTDSNSTDDNFLYYIYKYISISIWLYMNYRCRYI